MNTKYFGETLEGTGQAEDYRLKLSPKKGANNTKYCNKDASKWIYVNLLLTFC